jgi:ADP-ribose pyrophosphatase YjhB (NUDIX family)
LPGGHLKKGENYEQGAARETKEETNLPISRYESTFMTTKRQSFISALVQKEIFLCKKKSTLTSSGSIQKK